MGKGNSKRKVVSYTWYLKAMEALDRDNKILNEQVAFVEGFQSFLLTRLTPEQQKQLEEEIADWIARNEDLDNLK
ncbi:hypothetical protein KUA24_69 [Vibrio phage HNL01]|nr:hypothetical protein KUA24_69 [Vibrio phage HNL01]